MIPVFYTIIMAKFGRIVGLRSGQLLYDPTGSYIVVYGNLLYIRDPLGIWDWGIVYDVPVPGISTSRFVFQKTSL